MKNMMNLKTFIAALLLLPASFCMAQDKFEISGNLPAVGNGNQVILSYVNAVGKNVKDSTLVKNGKFTISGTTAHASKAYLSITPVKKDTSRRYADYDSKDFYLQKGKYVVTGKDSLSTASISGTQAQADYIAYTIQMGNKPALYRKIGYDFLNARAAKDTVKVKQIQAEAKPLMAKMEAVLDSFIYNHGDSYVSADLINDNKTMVIDPETFDPYYKALSPKVLAGFTGQKLTEKYNKAKQIAIGKTVEFTQTDDKGNEFKLSSLKGKYVLVDFWASWCGPCRAENPHLLKAYNQLKGKNFEIVGVSLDETKAAWLGAVKQDGMPWIQVSDLKGFKSDVAVKYGISAIPQNFLINPQGAIIAKNLRGEDVDQKLSALIK